VRNNNLAYLMFQPERTVANPVGAQVSGGAPQSQAATGVNLQVALMLAVPISFLAGVLGVGPGFLLMPTLILVGYASMHAAAMNALAVTPPSFAALLPYLESARIDFRLSVVLLVIGAAGAFVGARISSLYVLGRRLKQIFGVLIGAMIAYKLYQIAT
jgi:uncharacterized membrane protein YfcA